MDNPLPLAPARRLISRNARESTSIYKVYIYEASEPPAYIQKTQQPNTRARKHHASRAATASSSRPLPKPLSPAPVRALRFQEQVRHDAVPDRHDAQRHEVDACVAVEIVQLQRLLAGGDRTRPIRELLRVGAGEGDSVEAVGREVPDGPLRGAEMVEGLEERGDVQADDARHEGRDGEDHGGQVDGEAGVVEEGVEHDADAFAAVDDAEGVECDNEEEFGRSWKAGAEDGDCGEG